MAEDQDESSKTEEPTGKRLSDAREEGNVAQSPEVKLWFSMVATLVVVAVMAPPIARTLTGELTGLMEQAGNRPMDAASIGGILIRTLVITGKALALPLIVLTVAGVAGTLVQIGWRVRPAALMPSLSKL